MKKEAWTELAIGAIIPEPGTASRFHTGDWRSMRPIWHEDKCIHCFRCWAFCPDSAIPVEDGKRRDFDLRYCKGCGICAKECPSKVQAITMVLEADACSSES